MKVLLIAPSIRQSATWKIPDGIPRSISKNFGVYPWMGLCYLAGFLEKNNFGSEIIDIDAEHLDIASVIGKISKIKPNLIGISTISFTFLYALELAKEIKKHFDIPILFGGPHVSIYPQETVSHDCIDIGVVGEGEQTLLEVVRIFNGNAHDGIFERLKQVRGLAFKYKGETIFTGKRDFIKNIDDLPFPAVEKLNKDAYFGCNLAKPYMIMVTVRGCPFGCSFCSKEPWGNSFRFHSPERIVDEIEHYVNHLGIRAIDFYDDTFTTPRSRALKITSLIKKRNIKFDFGLMTRVDCIDKELLLSLKEVGCKVIAYGVEFGDPKIQKIVNKEFSVQTIKDAFRLTAEAGIRTVGFFMVGHPEETEAEINNTIRLIKGLEADYVKANILIPYPGSQLYRESLSTGKLKIDFWAELTKGKVFPLEKLMNTKINLHRLVRLRNYINRLPYLRFGRSNLLKVKKVKLFQDIKRTMGIVIGSYFDRKV